MKTWTDRHPDENAPDPDIEPDRPPVNLHSHHVFHDDKPSETACNMFVTTTEGDLDPFGRPLRQGR